MQVCVPRKVRVPFSVTADSGTQYTFYYGGLYPHPANYVSGAPFDNTAYVAGLGNSRQPYGKLGAVHLRLHSNGGWTFSELRVVITCVEMSTFWNNAIVGGLNPNPFANEEALHIYDSGTLTTATTPAIAESNTVSFLADEFLNTPKGFGTHLAVGLEWNTSAGAGTSQLTAMLELDEFGP